MRFLHRPHFWISLIILSYVILSVIYARATPPLEASDEYKHYPFVQHVQTEGQLPVLDPENPGRWLQEAAQPPLYYLLMAGLTAWIDTSDLPQVHHLNRQAFIGNPGQVGNKNLIIHDPDRETFPWQGTVLAVYIIRLASIGLGVGTVLLTAATGRLLFNYQVGLLAAALTAFNPMFLFISAAVNNDSLAILLGHTGLYLLLRLWQDAPGSLKWQRYAGLGVVLGLGVLTKLSLAGLVLLSGLALAWLAWRYKKGQILWMGGSILLVLVLLISGWWFWRNLRLYGGPMGLNVFIAVQGSRDEPLTLARWLDEWGTFYRSYWGLFGGVNVAAPEIFYWFGNLVALAGFVGLLRPVKYAKPRRSGVWLLAAWSGILFALLLRWNIISPAFQGRLIFPALGALNVLLAVGLLAWVQEGRRVALATAVAGAWLAAALLLPWLTIRLAYAYPEPVTAVPAAAQFGPVTFTAPDGAIQLVGVEMEPGQTSLPGDNPVKLALYWQAVAPVTADYLSAVHLLGRQLESVGSINRHPANGMIPTSRWRAGQIYRDVYHVYVNREAAAPALLRVNVSLYDPETEQDLPATGPDGQPWPLMIVGQARLAKAESQPLIPPVPQEVALADGITLMGYALSPTKPRPGDELALTLYWRANDAPSQDYTVFVHLLDSERAWLAGADAPPVANDYPTSLWQPGDQVDDLHRIPLPRDLPAGSFLVAVGLYDPVTGVRVSRLDGAGDSIEFKIEIGE